MLSPRLFGSGSLAFAAPLHHLDCHQPGVRGVPGVPRRCPKASVWVSFRSDVTRRRHRPTREVGLPRCCHPDLTTCVLGELRLASSVETIAVTASEPFALARPIRLRGLRASTLASGCPGHPVASCRLLLEVRLHRVSASVVYSQSFAPKSSRPSACSCQRTGPVPPSWFLTTSTGCSDFAVQVLLQPAADLGVHCVSGVHRLYGVSRKSPVSTARAVPAMRFTPRRISLPTAVPALTAPPPKGCCVTLGSCPPAVSIVRTNVDSQPASRPCSVVRSVASRLPLPASESLCPPMGFCPPFDPRWSSALWETHFSLSKLWCEHLFFEQTVRMALSGPSHNVLGAPCEPGKPDS